MNDKLPPNFFHPNFFYLLAKYIDGAIRILYNSEKSTFIEIFGETDGPYLWDKFTVDKNANEGDFICYLDINNQMKLATAVAYSVHSKGGITEELEMLTAMKEIAAKL